MAWIISWQFMGWPASPSTLAAASRALSFLGSAWALGFAFLGASPFRPARLAAPWNPSSLPFLVLASLAGLLLPVFGVVLVFVALMMHLLAGSRWVGCHPQAAGTTRRDARAGVSAL